MSGGDMSVDDALVESAAGAAEPPDVGQTTVEILIADLQPADSPRLCGLNFEHVRALADLDPELAPILVHRPTMRVIDGMHRLRAAGLRGRDRIGVRFFDGSIEEAFRLAVETNVAHGLPLTLPERRAAAERIIKASPDLSDRAVAATAGLGAKTVAAIRRRACAAIPQSNKRVGRDGRTRPLSSAEARRVAGELVARDPQAPLRRIAAMAGLSVGTVRDVRERVRRGEDPVPPAQRDKAGSPRSGVRPVARTSPPEEIPDCMSTLEFLRRDPSLRYTESGRALLRWLSQRAVQTDDLEGGLGTIPPQSAYLVARFARGCAAAWTRLAAALERDESDAGRASAA